MNYLHALVSEIEKAVHAEGRLARQILRSLWRQTARFGFTRDDADDIMHETLSEVLMNIHTREFRGHASIKTYAYKIGENICRKRLKKSNSPKHGGNAPHLPLEHAHIHLLEADPHAWNPLEILTRKERRHLTLQSIQELDNKEYRDVFLLVLDGYERDEISATLDMPVSRVDAVLNYGKKKLLLCFRHLARYF